MGFVGAYDRLDQAFAEEGRAEAATYGDVFLPSNGGPDHSTVIGEKINKIAEVLVPVGAGELVVAVTCQVFKANPEMCEGVIDLAYLSPWSTRDVPTMNTKQTLDWVHNDRSHQSRIFTGFSRGKLAYADQVWQEYRRGLEAGEEDKPYTFSELSHQLKVKLPLDTTGNEHHDRVMHHFEVLGKVAETLPALGYLAYSSARGDGVSKKQSPEQFETYVDWLLSEA